MNTMEINKIVGALCGSVLIFLLIQMASGAIFDTSSDTVAFVIDTGDADVAEAPAEAEEVDVAALVAAGDADAGAGIFRRCAACHRVDGTDATGPHLDGVIGRDKAAVDGFRYSATLTGLEGAWTVDDLYHFLQNPRGFAPGTSMAFAGLPKPEDLGNLIAYLESVSN